jgi:hypothetical protein
MEDDVKNYMSDDFQTQNDEIGDCNCSNVGDCGTECNSEIVENLVTLILPRLGTEIKKVLGKISLMMTERQNLV